MNQLYTFQKSNNSKFGKKITDYRVSKTVRNIRETVICRSYESAKFSPLTTHHMKTSPGKLLLESKSLTSADRCGKMKIVACFVTQIESYCKGMMKKGNALPPKLA